MENEVSNYLCSDSEPPRLASTLHIDFVYLPATWRYVLVDVISLFTGTILL